VVVVVHCVTTKLYITIILLVVSVVFYSVFEYRLRRSTAAGAAGCDDDLVAARRRRESTDIEHGCDFTWSRDSCTTHARPRPLWTYSPRNLHARQCRRRNQTCCFWKRFKGLGCLYRNTKNVIAVRYVWPENWQDFQPSSFHLRVINNVNVQRRNKWMSRTARQLLLQLPETQRRVESDLAELAYGSVQLRRYVRPFTQLRRRLYVNTKKLKQNWNRNIKPQPQNGEIQCSVTHMECRQ